MRIIEAELKRILGVSAEISKTQYAKHGDFSSNVLMKHRLKFQDHEFTSDIIEAFEVVNGHLNMYVLKTLSHPFEGKSIRTYKGRMKDVQERLVHEGYGNGRSGLVWPDLAKAYNLLNATMITYGSVKVSEVKGFIDQFEAYDKGHIYRSDSQEVLSGICTLLTYSIHLLERLIYEEHI